MDAADLQEKQAQTRRLQSDFFAVEGEKKQLERKHEAVMDELHRLKVAGERLEVEQQTKETEKVALERHIELLADEMKQLKRKMDAL